MIGVNREKATLDFFKVMVIDEDQKTGSLNFNLSHRGVILNFEPTWNQHQVIENYFQRLNLKTLFSPEEVKNSSPEELFAKQIIHYVEVYGLDAPGLFELEHEGGTLCTVNYVKGVSRLELRDMVASLVYSNFPIKDVETLKKIIEGYEFKFNINDIKNNELRVALFDPATDTFTSGDDVVRYMCYTATGNTLLIKSQEVIDFVKTYNSKFGSDFFERHEIPLAEVFNRHKRIILAAKNKNNRSAINRITRLSKNRHVPITEAINKRFISLVLNDIVEFNTISLDNRDNFSIRDKFKYLNILAYKKKQLKVDAFNIRNGKVHIEQNRKTYSLEKINEVENIILNSLQADLMHLKGKNIVLDKNVDYALPVSRKQTVGQLPFGTTVEVPKKSRISSGVYWKNSWGASDLDLSTIDLAGNRVGWGQFSGYDNKNPITFSGDITSAPTGAMEFMVSKKQTYGLFVNIYSGKVGCECEIVVGSNSDNNDDSWLEDALIREKTTLNSKGMVVGFVRDNKFIVYQGRLNNKAANFGDNNPIINKATVEYWTVRKLFDKLGINYKFDVDSGEKVDYNLTYNQFSFDKLEELLLN